MLNRCRKDLALCFTIRILIVAEFAKTPLKSLLDKIFMNSFRSIVCELFIQYACAIGKKRRFFSFDKRRRQFIDPTIIQLPDLVEKNSLPRAVRNQCRQFGEYLTILSIS